MVRDITLSTTFKYLPINPESIPNVDLIFRNNDSHSKLRETSLKVFILLLSKYAKQSKLCLFICVCMLSGVRLFPALRSVDCQASLSMEFARQEYCNELPFPPPGDLPDTGMESISSIFPALQVGFFTTEPQVKPNPNNAGTKYFLISIIWLYFLVAKW